GLPAVGGAEEGSVFHPGVDRVGVGQGRLQVPDPLELPRVLRPVEELVRGERLALAAGGLVDELVALAHRHAAWTGLRSAPGSFPGLAAVAGALDDLPEPAARL